MNDKLRRIIAGYIDIVMLSIIAAFILLLIKYLGEVFLDIIINNNSFYFYINNYIIIVFIVFLETVLLNTQSIGKRIMNLDIIYISNKRKVEMWKIFIRRLFTLITYPVSFISILFLNKTIMDIILKTQVIYINKVK